MKQSEQEKADSEAMFAADDPIVLLKDWMGQAFALETNAHAMALASVDGDGLPNVRMVLAKDISSEGIVFYTNFESEKGKELQSQQKAALCFHWKSLDRQVRVRGSVLPVSDTEADAYFASRDRESQIGAWASKQSALLENRGALEAEVRSYQQKFADKDVPRPPHWSGFCLTPIVMEFWHQRDFRLHDRLNFKRSDNTSEWTKQRLFP